MMKIDKNIPVPDEQRRKYPWREMEVGDSFAFPPGLKTYEHVKQANGRYFPKKFVLRKMNGTYRCWRME